MNKPKSLNVWAADQKRFIGFVRDKDVKKVVCLGVFNSFMLGILVIPYTTIRHFSTVQRLKPERASELSYEKNGTKQ